MKIIDNKKDYYDYLMGVYGQDEKVVYDRRGSSMADIGSYEIEHRHWRLGDKNLKYHLWIGNEYRCISYDDKYGWINAGIDKNNQRNSPQRRSAAPIELLITCTKRYGWNDGYTIVRMGNPILRDMNIVRKFIAPEFIWNHVYEYICQQKDKTIIDNRTDAQKLESHGFDKKTSFRNVK